jgi:hypothetical protein
MSTINQALRNEHDQKLHLNISEHWFLLNNNCKYMNIKQLTTIIHPDLLMSAQVRKYKGKITSNKFM